MQFDLDRRLARLRGRNRTVCVTGTNGKTTTTGMIAAVIRASGQGSARIDGFGCWLNDTCISAQPTIENACSVLEHAAATGVQHTLVEVTSQALLHRFACRWPPNIAVVTNVSPDHDHVVIHPTFEEYVAAKYSLLQHVRPGGTAVLNADDEATGVLEQVVPDDVVTRLFGAGALLRNGADREVALRAKAVDVARWRTRVLLERSSLADALGGSLELNVLGSHFAENALAAAVACDSLGVPADAIRAGLGAFTTRPGRFQIIAERPLVVVDYATSPHALAPTLRTARALMNSGSRLFCVFGCGGHPAHASLRPRMGEVAGRLSDRVVVTSDNPRWDDPERIASEIEQGGRTAGPANWLRELDRRKAIQLALEEADADDAIVIAGKGHEEGQTEKGVTRPFSDVDVARELHARSRLAAVAANEAGHD